VTLEFYGGDITTIQSDLMIASAFKGAYYPTPNSVLGAIYERFNLDLTGKKFDILHGLSGVRYVPQEVLSSSSFTGRLWIVEMIKHSNLKEEVSADIDKIFKELQRLGPVFDLNNVKTISLPLLGVGRQRLEIHTIVLKLMGLIRRWTHTSSIDTIRLFVYSLTDAAIVNRHIDEFFETFVDGATSSLLFKASLDELKENINSFDDVLKEYMMDLYNIASVNSPSISSLAIIGRKIAELCVTILIDMTVPELNKKNTNLDKKINKLYEHLENRWFYSYFRLLQFAGNHAAHDIPIQLTFEDASAILIASMRLAEYTSGKIDNNTNSTKINS
jgi:hypothetical protein